MKAAISIWDNRVSPVFDTARKLLLVEIENGQEVSRCEVTLAETWPLARVARLKELGVSVLLCGAISRPLAAMLISAGIQIVPFMMGNTEEILNAYLKGHLPDPRFLMPGCCGRRFRHGWGHGSSSPLPPFRKDYT